MRESQKLRIVKEMLSLRRIRSRKNGFEANIFNTKSVQCICGVCLAEAEAEAEQEMEKRWRLGNNRRVVVGSKQGGHLRNKPAFCVHRSLMQQKKERVSFIYKQVG